MANTLNGIIKTDEPTVTTVFEKMRSEEYFVDNSFQRRLVWTEKQKVRLIETILIGFPMPEIYLWQQHVNTKTGKQRSSIVDGQQRLTTIKQFIGNEWPLKEKYLDKENRNSVYAGKLWKDLPNDIKAAIWGYAINVRRIPDTTAEKDVRKVFQRLNETDRSLNPQELRHAEFRGPFITTAELIADMGIWKKWDFFSPMQIRRMQDIEFSSGLLRYLRLGIEGDTTTALNEMFDLYNEVYKEKNKDLLVVRKLLKRADAIFSKSQPVSEMFRSIAHFYPLFVVLHSRVSKFSEKTITLRLVNFVKEYGKKKSKNKLVEEYRQGASFRTRSKQSRLQRIDSLSAWLLKK